MSYLSGMAFIKSKAMKFCKNELYHLYNRGNRKQKIFFNDDNYIYFLRKVRKFIKPHCEILNYCLMPNHFHFLIYADANTILTKGIGSQEKNVLSEGVRNLLHTYTKGINKQNNLTGSLFQQNTKAKVVFNSDYRRICFHYIHQNPIKAKLTDKMEDWPYSSFSDYIGRRTGTLCNTKMAFQMLGMNPQTFYADSYQMINDEEIQYIF